VRYRAFFAANFWELKVERRKSTGTIVVMRLMALKIVVFCLTIQIGRLPFAKYGLERWGGRVEPKNGLDASL
jgi:hypothetical protein